MPTALLCSITACGGDTALKLRFVADPLLNTEAQIISAIDQFELNLDAAAGFSRVPAKGALGAFTAEDIDADGTLELVLKRTMAGRSALPRFRLLPGGNILSSFQVTARGVKAGQVAAIGGLASVRFSPGESLDLLVPFNLRAAFRPPRVLLTMPHDGQTGLPSALSQIYLEFSKLVADATVPGNLLITYQGSAGDQAVPGKWELGLTGVNNLGMKEQHSTATYRLGCSLNPGTYRIEARAAIKDRAGIALDQDSAKDGDNPYLGRFVIDGKVAAGPCTSGNAGCKTDEHCNPPGNTTKRYVCRATDGKEYRCVLNTQTCGDVTCKSGYVCRPPTKSRPRPECVRDCRAAGTCGDPNHYCEKQSGLCKPCTDSSSGCPLPRNCQQLCAGQCKEPNQVCKLCLDKCNSGGI